MKTLLPLPTRAPGSPLPHAVVRAPLAVGVYAGAVDGHDVSLHRPRLEEMAQILKQHLAQGTLRIPYDRTLLEELNTERYTLTKTGRIALDHPHGTHDDRFWALALVFNAAERPRANKPKAKTA